MPRETTTTFLQRCEAAADLLEVMRWHYDGVCRYKDKVYALRIWNEATVLIEADSEGEARKLAEAFNKVNIKKAREEYRAEHLERLKAAEKDLKEVDE